MTAVRRRDVQPIIVAAACAAALCGAAPAFAQAAAYQSVFGATPSAAPASAAPQVEDPSALDDAVTAATGKPGARGLTRPQAGRRTSPDLPYELAEQLRRRLNPPAGTRLVNVNPVARSVTRRLGGSAVMAAAAGTRLGGGYNFPSPEAVTIDPRDRFDAFVASLADPRHGPGY